MRRHLFALCLLVLAVLGGAVIGRAATNSNSVPDGRLGQGSQATSPYAITAITYALDPNNPRNVASVSFTINPSNPRVVKARLSNGGTWYTCSNVAGSVTCATAVLATSADNLTVVATQ